MTTGPTPGGGRPSRELEGWVVDLAIKLLLLGLFAWWSLQLIAPFIIIVIWAAILATAIYPLHAWLARRLGGGPPSARR